MIWLGLPYPIKQALHGSPIAIRYETL